MPAASRQRTEHVSSREPPAPSPPHQGSHSLDFQWALRRCHPLPSVQGGPEPLRRRGEKVERQLPGFLCTLVPWSWLGPHGPWGFSSQPCPGTQESPLASKSTEKHLSVAFQEKTLFSLSLKIVWGLQNHMPNCVDQRTVAKFHFFKSWNIQGRAVQLACIPGHFFSTLPSLTLLWRQGAPRLPVLPHLVIATSCPERKFTLPGPCRLLSGWLWEQKSPATPKPVSPRVKEPAPPPAPVLVPALLWTSLGLSLSLLEFQCPRCKTSEPPPCYWTGPLWDTHGSKIAARFGRDSSPGISSTPALPGGLPGRPPSLSTSAFGS